MQGVSKRRFQTKACIAGMKTFLMLFNVLFGATGLILFILGLWMKLSLSKYMALDGETNFALPPMFMAVGLTMIGVGFWACNCTANGQTRLLYMYGSFLFAAFVVVTSGAMTGYAYRSSLSQGFREGLNNAINKYGNGDLLERDVTLVQQLLHCCGANNYTDWFSSPWSNGTEAVPGSCCRDPTQCVTRPLQSPDLIFQEGCYSKIVSLLSQKFSLVGYFAISIALFQLVGTVISCGLAKYINKAVYDQLE
jgi:hypothetical protein